MAGPTQAQKDAALAKLDQADVLVGEAHALVSAFPTEDGPVSPPSGGSGTNPGALPIQPGSPTVMPSATYYRSAYAAEPNGGPANADYSVNRLQQALPPSPGIDYGAGRIRPTLAEFWVWVGQLGLAELGTHP